MSQTYNSNAQEQFFKPYRLVVFSKRYEWNYSTQRDYGIALVDESKRPRQGYRFTGVEGTFDADGELLPLSDKPTDDQRRVLEQLHSVYWYEDPDKPNDRNRPKVYLALAWSSLSQAKAMAKKIAIERDLPFQLGRDPIDIEELSNGPVLPCAVCGFQPERRIEYVDRRTPNPRSWICDDCKQTIETGKVAEKASEGAETVGFHDTYCGDREWRIRELDSLVDKVFAPLLGQAPKTVNYERLNLIAPAGRKSHTERVNARTFELSKAQREAIEYLFAVMRQREIDARREGFRQGDGFVRRLAAGELTVNELRGVEAKR